MGWFVFKKALVYKAKREQKRDRSVHLEIFQMYSGEWQKKSKVTLKEQKRNKRHLRAEQEVIRGTTGGQKMCSRSTRDEQQKYNRCPTPN